MPRPKIGVKPPPGRTRLERAAAMLKEGAIGREAETPDKRITTAKSAPLKETASNTQNARALMKDHTMSGALTRGVAGEMSSSESSSGKLTRRSRRGKRQSSVGATDSSVLLEKSVQEDEVIVPSSMPQETRAFMSDAATSPDAAATRLVRAQATPLALTNFKRRARQPSILQIASQDASTMLNQGLDDFNPQLPSSPSHLSSFPNSPVDPLSSSSRKRKLSPAEVLVRRSQSEGPVLPSVETNELSSDELSEPESVELPTNPSQKRSLISESLSQVASSTMAPPQSSSPARVSEQMHSPAKHKSQKVGHKDQQATSKVSKYADTKKATRGKNGASANSKALSTASLQAMLPRRRLRPRGNQASIFDVLNSAGSSSQLSSAEDEDEDELSAVMPKRKKSTKATKVLQEIPLKKTRQKRRAKKAAAAAEKPTSNNTSKATYSRRASNKENRSDDLAAVTVHDDDDDDDDDAAEEGNSNAENEHETGNASDRTVQYSSKARKELQAIANKFKEVDRWEMEFETITASSSSPSGAR